MGVSAKAELTHGPQAELQICPQAELQVGAKAAVPERSPRAVPFGAEAGVQTGTETVLSERLRGRLLVQSVQQRLRQKHCRIKKIKKMPTSPYRSKTTTATIIAKHLFIQNFTSNMPTCPPFE